MKVTQAAQGLLDALAASTVEAVHRILGASVSAVAPDVASSCAVSDQSLVVSESQHSSAIRNGADLAQQGIGHSVQRHPKPSRLLDPQRACVLLLLHCQHTVCSPPGQDCLKHLPRRC